jgi:hypothetical protein
VGGGAGALGQLAHEEHRRESGGAREGSAPTFPMDMHIGGECAAGFQMCPGSCPALRDSLLDTPGSTDQDRCHEPGLPCAGRQPCLAVAAAGTAPVVFAGTAGGVVPRVVTRRIVAVHLSPRPAAPDLRREPPQNEPRSRGSWDVPRRSYDGEQIAAYGHRERSEPRPGYFAVGLRFKGATQLVPAIRGGLICHGKHDGAAGAHPGRPRSSGV